MSGKRVGPTEIREREYGCRRCERVLPVSAFSLRASGKIRPVRTLCRSCEYAALLEREAGAPEKKAARAAVFRALRSGTLERSPCELSDEGTCFGRLEAHHDDYSPARWLDVRWLCAHHHRATEDKSIRSRRSSRVRTRGSGRG